MKIRLGTEATRDVEILQQICRMRKKDLGANHEDQL